MLYYSQLSNSTCDLIDLLSYCLVCFCDFCLCLLDFVGLCLISDYVCLLILFIINLHHLMVLRAVLTLDAKVMIVELTTVHDIQTITVSATNALHE